nr:micronuclear linker histone polyprotein-like [Cherax quadricarinatus]
MARRRKAEVAAETENDAASQSTNRNKRINEVSGEENSNDSHQDIEEGNTSHKTLQRGTRGRTKGDSSNGEVQEEESVNSSKVRRSSRGKSIEKDRVAEAESNKTKTRTSQGHNSDKEEETSSQREQTRRKSLKRENTEEMHTPVRRSQRSSRGRSTEPEESEEEIQEGKVGVVGQKLGSIQEFNESQNDSPKKAANVEKEQLVGENEALENTQTLKTVSSKEDENIPQNPSDILKDGASEKESDEFNKKTEESPRKEDDESSKILKEKSPGKTKGERYIESTHTKEKHSNKKCGRVNESSKKEESRRRKSNAKNDEGKIEKESEGYRYSESKEEKKESSRRKLQRNEVKMVEEKTKIEKKTKDRSGSSSRSSSDSRSPSPKKIKQDTSRSSNRRDSGSDRERHEKKKGIDGKRDFRGHRVPGDGKKTSRPRLHRNEVTMLEEKSEKSEGRSRKDRFPSESRSSSDSSRSPSPRKHKKMRSSSSSSSSSSSRSRSRHTRKRFGFAKKLESECKKSPGKMHASHSPEHEKLKDTDQDKLKHKPIFFHGGGKKSRHSHSRSRSPKAKMPRSNSGMGSPGRDKSRLDSRRESVRSDKQQEEEKENKETKITVDYSTFKSVRKVSLSSGKSREKEDPDKPKKRKWGNTLSKKLSVDISSASLKTIIPDVKPLSASEVHMGEDSGPESGEASDFEGPEPPPPLYQAVKEEVEEKVEPKPRREVREVSPLPVKQRRRSSTPEEKPVRKIHMFEGPIPKHKPAIAPARNPPSRVVLF